MIDILSAIATILSLWGNYLVIKKRVLGFPIWILSNIFWILVNYLGTFNVSQVIMFIIYGLLNVYGWYEWYKNK